MDSMLKLNGDYFSKLNLSSSDFDNDIKDDIDFFDDSDDIDLSDESGSNDEVDIDVIESVQLYSNMIQKPYKVNKTDNTQFSSSKNRNSKLSKPRLLSKNLKIRKFFYDVSTELNSKNLHKKINSMIIKANYRLSYFVYKILKNKIDLPDQLQYQYLESYKTNMNKKVNLCKMEKTSNNSFLRFAALYYYGIRAFKQFQNFGLQLDATFLKNNFGGALLIA
ncbi:hypothetical protein BB558_004826 [Smittium angustum]|uniref:Uncharacterized protein n=1 Tax=Smittium angustum TaxID=133377 RepID=A0A2U1J297_SMIAN|nr:hypothetical protein BB558_004826 [Smittium angustum]